MYLFNLKINKNERQATLGDNLCNSYSQQKDIFQNMLKHIHTHTHTHTQYINKKKTNYQIEK